MGVIFSKDCRFSYSQLNVSLFVRHLSQTASAYEGKSSQSGAFSLFFKRPGSRPFEIAAFVVMDFHENYCYKQLYSETVIEFEYVFPFIASYEIVQFISVRKYLNWNIVVLSMIMCKSKKQ